VLTPAFQWIPRSSLGAVIITAVAPLVDLQHPLVLWRGRCLPDLVLWIAVLVISLILGVEIGILAGASLQLLWLLLTSSRPRLEFALVENKDEAEAKIARVKLGGQLNYINIGQLSLKVEQLAAEHQLLLLDAASWWQLDATAAKQLSLLSCQMRASGVGFLLLDAPEAVKRKMRSFGVSEELFVEED